MSKYEGHTPGPWRVRVWEGEEWPIKRVSISAGNEAIAISPRYVTKEEFMANAQLIADAPMLAERVEYLEEENFKLTEAIKAQSTAIVSAKIGKLAEQNEKMLAMLKRLYDKNLLYDNGFEEVHNLIAEIEGEK
jgi:hypothetical protein